LFIATLEKHPRFSLHCYTNPENWNSANGFIFYGKGGEIATNRLEDQEIAVLALHLLQACLVYINTLMIQQVLESPSWFEKMEPEDFRALSPLIYHLTTLTVSLS
jgi:TnpA family transposase